MFEDSVLDKTSYLELLHSVHPAPILKVSVSLSLGLKSVALALGCVLDPTGPWAVPHIVYMQWLCVCYTRYRAWMCAQRELSYVPPAELMCLYFLFCIDCDHQ